MEVMELRLRLSPKAVWQLNEIAESEGVTTGQAVERLLRFKHSGPKGRISTEQRDLTRQMVSDLNSQGLTDAEIGLRIDRVPAHVGRVRRELGLEPGRRVVV